MKYLYPFLLAILLASCRSSREAAVVPKATEAYTREVAASAPSAPALTAKVRADLAGFGGDISVSGNLRMKRDELIQLSFNFIGMEVARIEFSPTEVLVVNRMRKEYFRAPYTAVPQVAALGLDFRALQAVFWNELFAPGTPAGSELGSQLHRFALSERDGRTLLVLSDTPRVSYVFHTLPSTRRITLFEAVDRTGGTGATLSCNYDGFKRVEGLKATFPSTVKLAATLPGKEMRIDLSLTRISTSADWQKTTLNSRYKQAGSIKDLLKF